jgi:hypothetical protein
MGQRGRPKGSKNRRSENPSDRPDLPATPRSMTVTEKFIKDEFSNLQEVLETEIREMEEEFHSRISRIEQKLGDYRALRLLIEEERRMRRFDQEFRRNLPEPKARELQTKRSFS